MSQREGALGPWFEKGQDGESRPGWRERVVQFFPFLLFQSHFQNILKAFYFILNFDKKNTHLNKPYAPACMHKNVSPNYDKFQFNEKNYFPMSS
jgi:hypothetical protein